MKRNKKRKFLFYVVLTAIIIFMASMMFFYITDPVQLQLKLNEITNKVEYYILELNGMKALADENMQMPEQEKLTEAQKYYYYQQLNDTGKLIYISIENNIEKIIFHYQIN